MENNAILGPVAALALWSMVMWVWMYATRIPAMSRAKIDAAKMVGGTGKGLDDVLPQEVQWKAHNYNHLMEQPTIFYAVALALAIGGMGGGLNAQIAWAYVALRIVHSLIQATVNRVMWRFGIFALASLALLALCVHAFIGFVLH
ncbi:MAPEG family protein [Sphingopyxis sp. CCNWLW253]|uniref:MAPEG family protein n=1 Tax=unclassified Sphingopyxis TaxID=2614943 RepID=UPI003012C96F